MQNNATLIILGMALVTYLTRIGGLWVMNRISLTPRIEAWLNALPGTILMAIIAPTVFSTGLAEGLSGLVTVITAWRSKNLILAIGAGVFSVWMLRRMIGS